MGMKNGMTVLRGIVTANNARIRIGMYVDKFLKKSFPSEYVGIPAFSGDSHRSRLTR